MKLIELAVCSVCVLSLSVAVRSEEPKPADGVKKAEAPDDQFAIPQNADVKTLCNFCMKLFRNGQQYGRDAEKMGAYQRLMFPALIEASIKILDKDTAPNSGYAQFARHCLLNAGGNAIAEPGDKNGPRVAAELEKFINSPRFNSNDAAVAMRTLRVLQFVSPERAAVLYRQLEKAIQNLEDPWLDDTCNNIAGALRQLELVGKPFVLSGKTTDGKDFNIESLKGKVVLVDFWATWCGPCRAEIPNVKVNYEGYHNKGFEVVGISGDQDRDMLDKFLTKDALPWPTLHEKDGRHPAMETYGVNAFPTTFLVGKDGKVIALNARGPRLGELLKAQLGEPEVPKKP